jgi:hypothetical protein
MIKTAMISVNPAAITGCQNGTPPTVNLVIIMTGAESGKILSTTARVEWGLIANIIEKT